MYMYLASNNLLSIHYLTKFKGKHIKNQPDATLGSIVFINNCKFTTCFRRFLRPSSGVLKTRVFSTPDDGRRKRPKHVVNLQLLIKNNTAQSCILLVFYIL